MRVSASGYVPVRFRYPEPDSSMDGWGRLLDVSAREACLATRFRVERGQRLRLHFDMRGDAFEDVEAETARAWRDADGYYLARLKFCREEDALELGRSLRRFLI